MSVYQPIYTLIEESVKLFDECNQIPTNKGRYQRFVGILMHISHIEPDLAYVLSIVSQFNM